MARYWARNGKLWTSHQAAVGGRPWRVSIVDGDPDVRAALSLLLERHPTFAVVGAAGDLEALSSAERTDAILLDWDLSAVSPTTTVCAVFGSFTQARS